MRTQKNIFPSNNLNEFIKYSRAEGKTTPFGILFSSLKRSASSCINGCREREEPCRGKTRRYLRVGN